MDKATEKQIAETILSQLGGQRRLSAFVKGRDYLMLPGGGVTFKFSGNRKINYVRIRLNGKDLYDLEFIKIHGTSVKVKAEANDVYADQLVDTFEKNTGLYLSF